MFYTPKMEYVDRPDLTKKQEEVTKSWIGFISPLESLRSG